MSKLANLEKLMHIESTLMNAVQIIEEIDAMPFEEKSKVVAHILSLEEERYHAEQVKIAEQRLEELEKGLTSTVPDSEVKRMLSEI